MISLHKRLYTTFIAIPLLLGILWAAKNYGVEWVVLVILASIAISALWEYVQLLRRINIKDHPLIFIGILFVPFSLYFLYLIFTEPAGFALTTLVLALVWGYDSGAFFIGSWIGKTKLAPVISPNKTWEGVIGGFIFALILGFASTFWINWNANSIQPALQIIGLAALISLFSQLGDLYESKLKRLADVKDSGNLLPGHGGMLDRIDGLIPASIVFYFYLHWVLRWL